MPQYTKLQYHVHRALLDGVSPAFENYLLDEDWEREKIKMLAYSLTFFDRALRSKSQEEHESNLQNLVSTLAILVGLGVIMPLMSPMFKDPDIADFLEDENSVARVAEEAFGSYGYRNFKYKASKPKVPLWNLGGVDYKVKHICPSGVIVHFQGKISYLIPKSYRQTQLFFGDPSARGYTKSRRTNIRDLKIKCGNDEVSIWDKITVSSVAMIPRKDREYYTHSDRIAYIELGWDEDLGIEKALKDVGCEGNMRIVTKTNLKRYVPESSWAEFKKQIEVAETKFSKVNNQILNNQNEEAKKKSRDAWEKLSEYYKALKEVPEVNFQEPKKTRARVTTSNRVTRENSDEDDRMSITSEEL